jgi:hypothetical protein
MAVAHLDLRQTPANATANLNVPNPCDKRHTTLPVILHSPKLLLHKILIKCGLQRVQKRL